jgi:hypothetical protein
MIESMILVYEWKAEIVMIESDPKGRIPRIGCKVQPDYTRYIVESSKHFYTLDSLLDTLNLRRISQGLFRMIKAEQVLQKIPVEHRARHYVLVTTKAEL